MKLIFGLGNPGKEYENTRHNVGFMLIDKLINSKNLNDKRKFDGIMYETIINNEKIIYIKPLLYMNLSGIVVKKYIDFYKVNLEDILIIQDDLDMDFGRIKITYAHGDGGHNGIKNITEQLGTNEYLRIKIGISNDKDTDTKDYVLGKFDKDETKKIEDILNELDNLDIDFLTKDRNSFVQKYNTDK